MNYISGRTWAGDNSRSTIYQGFYCIIYDRNDSNFHYRIQFDPYNQDYILCRTGFKSFDDAESDMKSKAEYLRDGGPSLIDAEQKISSRHYL